MISIIIYFREPEVIRGSLQTSSTSILTFGMMLGSVLGSLVFNTPIWGWGISISNIFLLALLIVITGNLPFWYYIEELASTTEVHSLKKTFELTWSTLELKAVWWPMSFIYLYHVCQIPNSSWTNFLVIGLGFDDYDLGVISVASSFLYWIVRNFHILISIIVAKVSYGLGNCFV